MVKRKKPTIKAKAKKPVRALMKPKTKVKAKSKKIQETNDVVLCLSTSIDKLNKSIKVLTKSVDELHIDLKVMTVQNALAEHLTSKDSEDSATIVDGNDIVTN